MMIFANNFMKMIDDMATDIINKNDCKDLAIDPKLKKQMEIYAFSAVLYYHIALREELMDSGIDIGELKIMPLPKQDLSSPD